MGYILDFSNLNAINYDLEELLRYIVPIYFKEESKNSLVGTGFLVVEKNSTYLITAAHTFLKDNGSNDFSDDDDRYSIRFDGREFQLNFKNAQIEPEASYEKKLYADDAIFLMKDIHLDQGLEFERYQLTERRNIFHWYGFDKEGEELMSGDRTVVEDFQHMALHLKGGTLSANNCRMGFGYSQKGFSGGPILNPTSNKVIGMVVYGDHCISIKEDNSNKKQHFIFSDYLIQKLSEFITCINNN